MLSALQVGVLTETQRETVRALRAAIVAMATVQGAANEDADGPMSSLA